MGGRERAGFGPEVELIVLGLGLGGWVGWVGWVGGWVDWVGRQIIHSRVSGWMGGWVGGWGTYGAAAGQEDG